MTPMQAARVNALVGTRSKGAKGARAGLVKLLSPSQRALLGRIEQDPKAGWKSAIGLDFRKAWAAVP